MRQRRTAPANEGLRFGRLDDDDDDDEFMTTIISAWHSSVSPPVFILKMNVPGGEGGRGGEGGNVGGMAERNARLAACETSPLAFSVATEIAGQRGRAN